MTAKLARLPVFRKPIIVGLRDEIRACLQMLEIGGPLSAVLSVPACNISPAMRGTYTTGLGLAAIVFGATGQPNADRTETEFNREAQSFTLERGITS